ncbi:MAG TPA: hypothetical protein VN838_05520 [Bradyrhizobium sp.]|nr:hypothetical protein [Bradyrhizobium sp.]
MHVEAEGSSDETFLFLQARRSIELGLYFPAAVTAAVAFEYAVRQVGGTPSAGRRDGATRAAEKLTETIKSVYRSFLFRTFDDELKARLVALAAVHNLLLYPNNVTLRISKREAEQVVDAFEDGIDWMNEFIRNRQKEPANTDESKS